MPDRDSLPNLIIIGAMKCGTSALHYYLDLHPEASMSSPKELNFFSDEPVIEGELLEADPQELRVMRGGRTTWSRGLDWYAAHFDPSAKIRGEASPNYTAPHRSDAPEKIAATIPDAKLIFLVRDPIEQLVSQYIHMVAAGNETRPIDEALAAGNGLYRGRASYHSRLTPYLERFDRDQLLVLRQADLLGDRRATLRRVFEFLGIDPGYWTDAYERERHRSEAKQSLRARTVRRLQFGPLGRIGYRLPQEVKWWIERAAAAGGSGAPDRPALSPDVADQIRIELAPEMAAFQNQTGVDLPGWES